MQPIFAIMHVPNWSHRPIHASGKTIQRFQAFLWPQIALGSSSETHFSEIIRKKKKKTQNTSEDKNVILGIKNVHESSKQAQNHVYTFSSEKTQNLSQRWLKMAFGRFYGFAFFVKINQRTQNRWWTKKRVFWSTASKNQRKKPYFTGFLAIFESLEEVFF